MNTEKQQSWLELKTKFIHFQASTTVHMSFELSDRHYKLLDHCQCFQMFIYVQNCSASPTVKFAHHIFIVVYMKPSTHVNWDYVVIQLV